MWNQLLATVWVAIMPSVAGLVGLLVLGLLGALTNGAKTWAKSLKDKRLAAVVEMLVAAAEQQETTITGPDKRTWVLDQLAARGLKTDEAHIEAAVLSLKQLLPGKWSAGICAAAGLGTVETVPAR
ncbi:MAG: hypothetical protein ACYC63_04745 [Armatimonadota bacterium]